MPPKIAITPQQILDGAFELVRREGMTALSARRVAQELGCSTQPVYSAYDSMKALKADVIKRAEVVARTYLAPDEHADLPFLHVGLGSLRFAQKEPQLFRLVSTSGGYLRDLQHGKPPPGFLLERMKADPLFVNLNHEQLTRIHTLMWFFSQGLATLFLCGMDGDPMQLAQEYLMHAGRAVIKFEIDRSES